eukprot:gb/GEZN01005706.1/.p1 GENE.gb/GEZN01005706.1/~~gb/GEZN01005706.1/.p1  ORF type:complete len:520 (+),score=49.19 gb/GEZN01005706.1/:131-1690(+)
MGSASSSNSQGKQGKQGRHSTQVTHKTAWDNASTAPTESSLPEVQTARFRTSVPSAQPSRPAVVYHDVRSPRNPENGARSPRNPSLPPYVALHLTQTASTDTTDSGAEEQEDRVGSARRSSIEFRTAPDTTNSKKNSHTGTWPLGISSQKISTSTQVRWALRKKLVVRTEDNSGDPSFEGSHRDPSPEEGYRSLPVPSVPVPRDAAPGFNPNEPSTLKLRKLRLGELPKSPRGDASPAATPRDLPPPQPLAAGPILPLPSPLSYTPRLRFQPSPDTLNSPMRNPTRPVSEKLVARPPRPVISGGFDSKEPKTFRLRTLKLSLGNDALKSPGHQDVWSPSSGDSPRGIWQTPETPRDLPVPQPLQPGPLLPMFTPRKFSRDDDESPRSVKTQMGLGDRRRGILRSNSNEANTQTYRKTPSVLRRMLTRSRSESDFQAERLQSPLRGSVNSLIPELVASTAEEPAVAEDPAVGLTAEEPAAKPSRQVAPTVQEPPSTLRLDSKSKSQTQSEARFFFPKPKS